MMRALSLMRVLRLPASLRPLVFSARLFGETVPEIKQKTKLDAVGDDDGLMESYFDIKKLTTPGGEVPVSPRKSQKPEREMGPESEGEEAEDSEGGNMYEEGEEKKTNIAAPPKGKKAEIPLGTTAATRKCSGCGARFQSYDKLGIGYVSPKFYQARLEAEAKGDAEMLKKQMLCKRCRLLKYESRVEDEKQAGVAQLRKLNGKRLIDRIFVQVPRRSLVVYVMVLD